MSMYVVNGRPVYSDTLSHARPQLTYKPAGSKANYLAKTNTGRYLYTQEEIDALGREPQRVTADDGDKRIKLNARGKSSIPGLKMSPKSVTSSSKVSALRRYEARSGRPAPRNAVSNGQPPAPSRYEYNMREDPYAGEKTNGSTANVKPGVLERIANFARTTWNRVKETAVRAIDTVKRGFTAARNWVANTAVGRWARRTYQSIKQTADRIGGYFSGLTGIGGDPKKAHSAQFYEGQDTGKAHRQAVGNAVKGATKAVTDAWENSGAGPLVRNAAGQVGNAFNQAGQFIGNTAGQVGQAIGNTAGQVGREMIGYYSGRPGDTLGNSYRFVPGAIPNALSDAGQAIGNTAGQVGQWVGDTAGQVGNTAGQVGSGIANAWESTGVGPGVRQVFNYGDGVAANNYQRMASMPVVKEAISNGIPSESVNSVLQTLAATGNTSEQAVTSALNELASGTWDPNQAAQDAYVMNNYLQEQYLPEQILKEQYR